MNTLNEIKAAILEAGHEHIIVDELVLEDSQGEGYNIIPRREFIRTIDGFELACWLNEFLGFQIDTFKCELESDAVISLIDASRLNEVCFLSSIDIDEDEIVEIE